METIRFEAASKRESEYHVFGLVCEMKWAQAVAYFRQQHRPKWLLAHAQSGGQQAVAQPAHLATAEDTLEDAKEIVYIYCKISAERGESE